MNKYQYARIKKKVLPGLEELIKENPGHLIVVKGTKAPAGHEVVGVIVKAMEVCGEARVPAVS